VKESHDAQEPCTVCAGVPAENDRAGASGRSPDELAKEFEPTAQSIRNWLRQADLDEGRRHDGLTSDERQELSRLRRENRILRAEREILSKAAAWFATETGSVPSRRSNS
jgi:transposase